MEKEEFIHHWSYFCSLAEKLDETKHFVDHGLQDKNGVIALVHGNVYSDVFKQIIVLAASEFELMSKALCSLKGKKPGNIFGISKCILEEYPTITKVSVDFMFGVLKPLEEWRIINGKKEGLPWWEAYNAIKHGNKNAIKVATLENSFGALASLYIINLYLMREILGNMHIAYRFPAIYFNCMYLARPVSGGEGLLPGFGDKTPLERQKEEYPELFGNSSEG